MPHPVRNSYAFVGLRRTGKTAILHKLFNRLFYEQEAVLPVYISFADYLYRTKPITVYEFAEEFFLGYMRSYLGFRYRKPEFVRRQFDLPDLVDFAHEVQDEFASELCARYERSVARSSPYSLTRWLITVPMAEARIQNMPTAVIIDEFQVLTKVYNPKNGRVNALTDRFQKASETKWAPLLVSGSAVSLLVEDALGGMLSGRFKTYPLTPLSRSHTHDLVFRLAAKHGISVNEEFAEAIWLLTEGYPYSIDTLMNSESPQRASYPDLSALVDVLVFELTDQRGQLWTLYANVFGKYSDLLNDGPTTRRVMLCVTKYPGQRIDVPQIAEELGFGVRQVRASLDKLRWVDVVRKIGLISYQGPSDPMMRRYIEYQHFLEIENLSLGAINELQQEYESLLGKVSKHKGAMAEIHVGAIMGRFDGRKVDGGLYFNQPERVILPKFDKVELRSGVVEDGTAIEIDLIGTWTLAAKEAPQKEGKPSEQVDALRKEEAEKQEEEVLEQAATVLESPPEIGAWMVQVKYTQKRRSSTDIRDFKKQVEIVSAKNQYAFVKSWYVSKGGFTKPARQLLEESGILFSDRAEFNKLANLFGFFGLP